MNKKHFELSALWDVYTHENNNQQDKIRILKDIESFISKLNNASNKIDMILFDLACVYRNVILSDLKS